MAERLGNAYERNELTKRHHLPDSDVVRESTHALQTEQVRMKALVDFMQSPGL